MSNSLIPTLESVIESDLGYIVTLFITMGISFILGLTIGFIWVMTI